MKYRIKHSIDGRIRFQLGNRGFTPEEEDISEQFYNKVAELQKYLKEKYPHGWWTNFKFNRGMSYFAVKVNIFWARLSGVRNG